MSICNLNICHFISSQGLGRGEFYIDLVNSMSMDSNLAIFLLVPINSKFKDRIDSKVNLIEYSSKDSRNNIFLYLELYKIFKEKKFDIVHTHFAKSSEIFYKLNKLLKVIHVATKHNPRKGKIFNKLKYVTAVSKDVSDSIKSNYKTTVINNGILPIQVKDSLIENEKFTIRAIGRLDKIKGFDILIKEFSKLKNDALLEIIGDGEEYNSLINLIKVLKLENKVKLVGFRKNIPELIASSDMVIMTSHSEGFSLVMLESIFYAKLFVSTKVSGCRDILTEKLFIDHFNIATKIDHIIEDYELYIKEFKDISRKYKEEFHLDNTVKKYIQFYQKVLKIENSSN